MKKKDDFEKEVLLRHGLKVSSLEKTLPELKSRQEMQELMFKEVQLLISGIEAKGRKTLNFDEQVFLKKILKMLEFMENNGFEP